MQDVARKVSSNVKLCKLYGYKKKKNGHVPEAGEESLVPQEKFLTGRGRLSYVVDILYNRKQNLVL